MEQLINLELEEMVLQTYNNEAMAMSEWESSDHFDDGCGYWICNGSAINQALYRGVHIQMLCN